MNKKTTPYSHAFDEYMACKGLFERKSNPEVKEKFKSYINFTITNNSVIEVCKAVSKYLLFGDIYKTEEDKIKYQNPFMVRKLLWKWVVVNIYLWLDIKDSHLIYKDLEHFKNGIDVYDLIDLELNDGSIFQDLLENKDITDKTLSERLGSKYSKFSKNISSLIRLNYNFFCYDAHLEFYSEGRHNSKFDLVVCEAMNDNKFFKFDFEILDEDKFKENLLDDKDTAVRNAATFVGLFANKILTDKKVSNEFLLNRNRINIFTLNKDFNMCTVIKFVSGDPSNDIRKINYKEIVPFRVKYNGEEYMIDVKGVHKTHIE